MYCPSQTDCTPNLSEVEPREECGFGCQALRVEAEAVVAIRESERASFMVI
jgi:hypothetical protein